MLLRSRERFSSKSLITKHTLITVRYFSKQKHRLVCFTYSYSKHIARSSGERNVRRNGVVGVVVGVSVVVDILI